MVTTQVTGDRRRTAAPLAIGLAAARRAARRADALAAVASSLARTLGQVRGERGLHRIIVEAAARTAGARVAALAIYQPGDAAIAIPATYGYPAETVGHVRIAPGAGIIGGVFQAGKPLLVRDAARVPGLALRSHRYRTASFMAVPLVSGADTLGVVTLADRADGRAFTRHDLAAVRTIAALCALAIDRGRLARLADELAHRAAVDPLTGMFNRRYLHSRLDAELEHTRRTGAPLALLMLDVDGFKAINDRLGHQTGDAVLRTVAGIVRRSVRASDVCTRYGGDEFAVIVPENAASAAHTAERIRHRVEAFRWDAGAPPLRVTISAGAALAEPGDDAGALIGRADRHLYRAKAHGRNRVHPVED